MLVTILQADVASDKQALLEQAFEASGALPSAIRESFLLHENNSESWRIVTVWNSQEELEEYRRSVDTPAGITMFREAGAEPTLSINEVADHLTH